MATNRFSSHKIEIQTPNGYIKQIDGLGMGIPCAPQLANIWMASFDKKIKGDSKIYARYIDDILMVIKKLVLKEKLSEINRLHKNLSFTTEEEKNGAISFLDMKLIHKTDGSIETEWFRKDTDTGLTLNYHALAPTKYKRSLVINLIHHGIPH